MSAVVQGAEGRVSSVVRHLMGSREGLLSTMQSFPPLDVSTIANELRLEARATESGQQQSPPADSTGPDAVELDIDAEIAQRARKAKEEYHVQLDLYDSRIRRAIIGADQRIRIEAEGMSALTDFKVHSQADDDVLHSKEEDVRARANELRRFRTENGISRDPNIVTPRERAARWLVLGIAVILESVLNGMFFAAGSDAGIIGGFIEAIFLSIFNIGGSALIAYYFLRFLWHRHWGWKALGIVGIPVYIAWTVTINLAIGHYRDLYMVHGESTKLQDLLLALSGPPTNFVDVQSVMLVLMGIGLSLVAVIDVLGMHDRYPGYDEVAYRRKKAYEAFTDEKRSCLERLEKLRNHAIADMTDALDYMTSAAFDLEMAREGRNRLHDNLLAYMDQLAEAHARLVSRYRTANRQARTEPAPKYFDEPVGRQVQLDRSSLPTLAELQKDNREAIMERLEKFIELVNQEYLVASHRYQTIGRLTLEGTPLAASA